MVSDWTFHCEPWYDACDCCGPCAYMCVCAWLRVLESHTTSIFILKCISKWISADDMMTSKITYKLFYLFRSSFFARTPTLKMIRPKNHGIAFQSLHFSFVLFCLTIIWRLFLFDFFWTQIKISLILYTTPRTVFFVHKFIITIIIGEWFRSPCKANAVKTNIIVINLHPPIYTNKKKHQQNI